MIFLNRPKTPDQVLERAQRAGSSWVLPFFFKSKTQSTGLGQELLALPVKILAVLEYWSVGVLECWKKPKPEIQLA
jgi:hypothetical protein